jgi:hypothetical protein
MADQIVSIKLKPETIINFFQIATENVSKHPSRTNYKILLYYLDRLNYNYSETFEKEFYDKETG